MIQIPQWTEVNHISPYQMLQLLRPVSEVTPIPKTAGVEHEPHQQERDSAAQAALRSRAVTEPPEPEDLAAAVEEINAFLLGVPTNLKFRVDEDLGAVVVSVIDSESGEVLRQIPSEEVLVIAQRVRESNFGLFDSVA